MVTERLRIWWWYHRNITLTVNFRLSGSIERMLKKRPQYVSQRSLTELFSSDTIFYLDLQLSLLICFEKSDIFALLLCFVNFNKPYISRIRNFGMWILNAQYSLILYDFRFQKILFEIFIIFVWTSESVTQLGTDHAWLESRFRSPLLDNTCLRRAVTQTGSRLHIVT